LDAIGILAHHIRLARDHLFEIDFGHRDINAMRFERMGRIMKMF